MGKCFARKPVRLALEAFMPNGCHSPKSSSICIGSHMLHHDHELVVALRTLSSWLGESTIPGRLSPYFKRYDGRFDPLFNQTSIFAEACIWHHAHRSSKRHREDKDRSSRRRERDMM